MLDALCESCEKEGTCVLNLLISFRVENGFIVSWYGNLLVDYSPKFTPRCLMRFH